MRTVCCVVGARPNFVKIAPLLRELAGRGWPFRLVHTGQHFDERMAGIFFSELGIGKPDVDLGIGAGTHAGQTARIMLAFDEVAGSLSAQTPIVVVGDVNSTIACALVGAKRRLPVVHVEAGLRSFDRTMPEELNRIVTDQLSDLCLAPSLDAIENLAREGITGTRVELVGNIMIDTLMRELPEARGRGALTRFGLEGREFAFVTLHRPSNVDDPAMLTRLARLFARLAERMAVVLPLHPRTAAKIAESGGRELLGRVNVVEPLAYHDCLALMDAARVVLTDSGGIQEETTVLGVPCLTLRESTERPVTVSQGTNQVVGTEPSRIAQALDEVLARPKPLDPPRPPLWDGHTAERIADRLRPLL